MLRFMDLAKLNSLTKYPSIPTYHVLGQKGRLTEERNHEFIGDVVLTEKIDGTNGRIVVLPNGQWVIGSREDFLTASGDIVYNPALGIVDALRPVADKIVDIALPNSDEVITFYFEVYGGNIGGQAKNYTTSKTTFGVRLFDIAHTTDLSHKLEWEREQIASWREHGGQEFASEWRITDFCAELGLPRVPYLFTMPGKELPTTVEGMHKLLTDTIATTRAPLDDSARKKSEGLVLRTLDRSQIAKARFEDYERTAKLNARLGH